MGMPGVNGDFWGYFDKICYYYQDLRYGECLESVGVWDVPNSREAGKGCLYSILHLCGCLRKSLLMVLE